MVSERDECLSVMMDIGESMIGCGADVHTVEETLVRMGRAYGAVRMNVLVITVEIIATAFFPDEEEMTLSRRIITEGGSDFAKLDKLTALCIECCDHPLPSEELRSRYEAIKATRISNVALYLGGVIAAAGFAVFFGGSIRDAVMAAVFALLTCLFLEKFKPITPNVIVFNFVTSLVVGTAICLTAALLGQVDANMVIVGVIMLLIPGVAMTNATRDMLSGDTISGVMRFIESLLWATSLAMGFMVALWISAFAGAAHPAPADGIDWPLWVMIPITFASALGFALFFNVRRKYVLIATIGGLLTWLVFKCMAEAIGGVFIPTLIASTFAAIYAEILSWRLRVPNEVFFIIAVIPLIPGRLLYYTMYSAVGAAWSDCLSYGLSTLLYAAGIAVGICIVAAFMQIRDGIKKQSMSLMS